MNTRSIVSSKPYLIVSFLSLVLLCSSCTSIGNLVNAMLEHDDDAVKLAEAYQQTLVAILETCHRNGKFTEYEIEFAKEPACRDNLNQLHQFLGPNILGENQESYMIRNKDLPKEFSVLRHQQPGKIEELANHCQLHMDSLFKKGR